MGVSVYHEVTMTTATTTAVGTSAAASSSSSSPAGHSKATASSNVLMCRQWWKVCWMYGDQEKYYRQLYGAAKKSSPSSPASAFGGVGGVGGGGGGGGRATVMELQQMSTLSFVPSRPLPQQLDDRLVCINNILLPSKSDRVHYRLRKKKKCKSFV